MPVLSTPRPAFFDVAANCQQMYAVGIDLEHCIATCSVRNRKSFLASDVPCNETRLGTIVTRWIASRQNETPIGLQDVLGDLTIDVGCIDFGEIDAFWIPRRDDVHRTRKRPLLDRIGTVQEHGLVREHLGFDERRAVFLESAHQGIFELGASEHSCQCGNHVLGHRPHALGRCAQFGLCHVLGHDISLSQALELIAAHQQMLRERIIKTFPENDIEILKGRYGPFVTDGKRNASVPKDLEPDRLDLAACLKLLAEAPARGRRGKFGKKKASPAAVATKKKTARKKAGKKKAARKKASPGKPVRP